MCKQPAAREGAWEGFDTCWEEELKLEPQNLLRAVLPSIIGALEAHAEIFAMVEADVAVREHYRDQVGEVWQRPLFSGE